MKKNNSIRLLTFTALFTALAVLGSFIHFPIGPVKVSPFQHAINVVAGIIIGPWYGMIAAFLTALVRLMLGTGTIFAFPGDSWSFCGWSVVPLLYSKRLGRLFRTNWNGFDRCNIECISGGSLEGDAGDSFFLPN